MTDRIRVMVESGPKGKKVVAVAPDWPGLERGAKTETGAVERLLAYVPRYTAVVTRAGLEGEFGPEPAVEVVERYAGTGSTDFWGISFAFSAIDHQELSADALERQLALMQACWAWFDDVRSRVSAELQKGPRGGGRDRDQIVRHVFANERDWAKGLGVATPEGAMLTDEGLRAHRDDYVAGIREFHAHGKQARTWPIPFLIRHTAYHTMDHAWEMEDKDLTERGGDDAN
jgi:hypothetical protein